MYLCVVFFFFYTITRLVFSIRVTQEGFSKVGKQQHSCPLCVVFTLLSGYSFLSLRPHNMYAHTRTFYPYPFPRTSCARPAYVCVSTRVFAPSSKSRQRSVTIFNKWISHRRPDSADGAYYCNTVDHCSYMQDKLDLSGEHDGYNVYESVVAGR